MYAGNNTIAAVIVWYDPCEAFVENIKTYARFMRAIYIIDNSHVTHAALADQIEGARYIWHGRNNGIAAALNEGCAKALADGFSFALTMDQDSAFDETNFCNLQTNAENLLQNAETAIVAPAMKLQPGTTLLEKQCVITSGNILRLDAWQKVGGFNEAYFIDQVDFEFCYRLRRAGLRIFTVSSARMKHQVGKPQLRQFLGKSIRSSGHNPDRRYYMTRNRLDVRKRFPDFPKPYLRKFLTEWLGILIVERNRLDSFKAIAEGIWDYAKGRSGPRRARKR